MDRGRHSAAIGWTDAAARHPVDPAGSIAEDAATLYGERVEAISNDDFPERRDTRSNLRSTICRCLGLAIGCQCSGISLVRGEPTLDLETVMKKYCEGQAWKTVNEGYAYLRADGRVRLCVA